MTNILKHFFILILIKCIIIIIIYKYIIKIKMYIC